MLFGQTTPKDHLKVGFRTPNPPFLFNEPEESHKAGGPSIRLVSRVLLLHFQLHSELSVRFLLIFLIAPFRSLPCSHKMTSACDPAFSFAARHWDHLDSRF